MAENVDPDQQALGVDPGVNPRLRRFAELEIDRQSANIDRALDQHVADFRWLTASLLLLNSGAAVAIMNSNALDLGGKRDAGLAYLVGCALALAIGRLSQHFGMKSLNPLVAYRAFWIAVSQGEAYNEAMERKVIADYKSSIRGAWLTQASGWLSFLAFVVGCAEAGAHLTSIVAK